MNEIKKSYESRLQFTKKDNVTSPVESHVKKHTDSVTKIFTIDLDNVKDSRMFISFGKDKKN